MRKKPKDEPIDVEAYEADGGLLLTDDTGQSSPTERIPAWVGVVHVSIWFRVSEVKPDLLKSELAVDDEEVEPDSELQTALARARRLRQVEERAAFKVPKVSL